MDIHDFGKRELFGCVVLAVRTSGGRNSQTPRALRRHGNSEGFTRHTRAQREKSQRQRERYRTKGDEQ